MMTHGAIEVKHRTLNNGYQSGDNADMATLSAILGFTIYDDSGFSIGIIFNVFPTESHPLVVE